MSLSGLLRASLGLGQVNRSLAEKAQLLRVFSQGLVGLRGLLDWLPVQRKRLVSSLLLVLVCGSQSLFGARLEVVPQELFLSFSGPFSLGHLGSV